MPRRFCEDCPATFDAADGGTRCPACRAKATTAQNARRREYGREYEATRRKPRGTTTQRGYDAAYQKASRALRRASACHWCALPFTAEDPLTIDHVVALARGGTNDPANLVAAHRSCNSRRGGQMNRG